MDSSSLASAPYPFTHPPDCPISDSSFLNLSRSPGRLTAQTLYPFAANFLHKADPVASPAPIMIAEYFEKSFLRVFNCLVNFTKL